MEKNIESLSQKSGAAFLTQRFKFLTERFKLKFLSKTDNRHYLACCGLPRRSLLIKNFNYRKRNDFASLECY
jgi:hypothetical protein